MLHVECVYCVCMLRVLFVVHKCMLYVLYECVGCAHLCAYVLCISVWIVSVWVVCVFCVWVCTFVCMCVMYKCVNCVCELCVCFVYECVLCMSLLCVCVLCVFVHTYIHMYVHTYIRPTSTLRLLPSSPLVHNTVTLTSYQGNNNSYVPGLPWWRWLQEQLAGALSQFQIINSSVRLSPRIVG
jgi:hypothetical protein